MSEFEISIMNLKLVHKNRIEELKKKIEDLEIEIKILKDFYDRIDDL